MKVAVIDNAHLKKTPDGKYYSTKIYSYDFFKRYLNVFENVRFVSKVEYVDSLEIEKHLLVSGKNLEIYEIPYYKGFKQLLIRLPKVVYAYLNVFISCNCCIFRIAQIESYMAYFIGKKRCKPYAIEVVNDPETFLDLLYVCKLINLIIFKILIKNANGVAYVTDYMLQKKYPCKAHFIKNNNKYFTSSYSSIDLSEDYLYPPKKYKDIKARQLIIIHTANSIDNDVKGHSVVLNILYELRNKGYNVIVQFIGDGLLMSHFKLLASKLKIEDSVVFLGYIYSKSELFQLLRKADIFVMPTKLEGLPRSVIEAMAAGLPCLSTPIAGIPELLEKKYLFDPEDVCGFTKMIESLINNYCELEIMSLTNCEKVKKYSRTILNEKRKDFYMKLKNIVKIKSRRDII